MSDSIEICFGVRKRHILQALGQVIRTVIVELMFAMPKSKDWSRFRSGVMVGGGRRSWLAIGRRMSLAPELAAVSSWFGDCRALRAKRFSKHFGINNPLRGPFLGGREYGGCPLATLPNEGSNDFSSAISSTSSEGDGLHSSRRARSEHLEVSW